VRGVVVGEAVEVEEGGVQVSTPQVPLVDSLQAGRCTHRLVWVDGP
jgi:hypothetical protein